LVVEIDGTNRKLITLLQEHPSLTQSELAKKLGISQSAVAFRLRKLKENKIFSSHAGVDLNRIGLQLAQVDLSTDNVNSTIEFARTCPLCVNMSTSVGDRNLSLLFAAEDIEMFQAIVDSHIRRLQGVSSVSFRSILSWGNVFSAQIRLDLPRSKQPPCGMMPYCPKCPGNPNYDGAIFTAKSSGA
jgi:DNA-binding Lrp family transcriptional regulator